MVIDMQNCYLELPGLRNHRDRILGRVNELIHTAHAARRPVVLVRTQHARDRSTWTLNMWEDDEGFAFPDTSGAQFLDDLARGPDVVINKTRDSAFHATNLAEHLRDRDVSHVLLCGVSTHSCVFQTATDGFAHDFHVAIAVDAVASETPDLSGAMLDFLHEEMRQPLLSQRESSLFLER